MCSHVLVGERTWAYADVCKSGLGAAEHLEVKVANLLLVQLLLNLGWILRRVA